MAYKVPPLAIEIPEGSSQAFIPGTSDIIALVKSGNPTFSPQEYAHCITQIRAAENVMQDFDLSFQCYEGKGEQR